MPAKNANQARRADSIVTITWIIGFIVVFSIWKSSTSENDSKELLPKSSQPNALVNQIKAK